MFLTVVVLILWRVLCVLRLSGLLHFVDLLLDLLQFVCNLASFLRLFLIAVFQVLLQLFNTLPCRLDVLLRGFQISVTQFVRRILQPVQVLWIGLSILGRILVNVVCILL